MGSPEIRVRRWNALALCLALGIVHPLRADEPQAKDSSIEPYLLSGRVQEGVDALALALDKNPNNAQIRFELGAARFIRTVERLAQSLHRHGFQTTTWRNFMGIAGQMPVPANPSPEPIGYEDARRIIKEFVAGIAEAETTLSKVQDEVKLPIHFAQIRLDLDGDGEAQPEETLWRIYARLNRQAAVAESKAQQFVITFDTGDVHWLRGYCHLLMAMGDFALAHDWRQDFEACAHLVFPKVKSPHDFLRHVEQRGLEFESIIDVVAAIHSIHWEVVEPRKMASARRHLLGMIEQSRAMWKSVLAEQDDDREWIPNPNQAGVIPNVRVTKEMVDSWTEILAESEDLLEGRKLVPFWRTGVERGVNLKKVFEEPTTFDLILWVQGTAATPYLEAGPLTEPETWSRLLRVFRGEFIGFAIWFN